MLLAVKIIQISKEISPLQVLKLCTALYALAVTESSLQVSGRKEVF